MVYTGRTAPSAVLIPDDAATDPKIVYKPIRVLTDLRDDSLHPESLINYGKVYTIEHNIPVGPFGVVALDDLRELIRQAAQQLDLTLPPLTAAQTSVVQHAESSSRYSTRTAPNIPRLREVTLRILQRQPILTEAEAQRLALEYFKRKDDDDDDGDDDDENDGEVNEDEDEDED